MSKFVSRKNVLAFVCLCAVVILGFYFFFKPLSPDDVARLSVHALEHGNVDTLLELTLPQERQQLNLTPASVRGFLGETLWAKGFPENLHAERIESVNVDEILYAVRPLTPQENGMHYPLYLMVTDSPDHGWRLALSFTLFESAALRTTIKSPDSVANNFSVIAQRYGIQGKRCNTSGYTLLKDEKLDEDSRQKGM